MHLLVVEDDVRLTRTLRRLLQDDRHVVEIAGTAAAAADVLEGSVGLDALILDIGWPDRSGLAVAKDLRRTGSNLPILAPTAATRSAALSDTRGRGHPNDSMPGPTSISQ